MSDDVITYREDDIELRRVRKGGKYLGRYKEWDEDTYRVYYYDKGQEKIRYEGLVNDSFIQHNARIYRNFINEHGERKDDR